MQPENLADANSWVERYREARKLEKQIKDQIKQPKPDTTELKRLQETKDQIEAGLEAWAMEQLENYIHRFADENRLSIKPARDIAQWTDGKHFLPSAMCFVSEWKAEVEDHEKAVKSVPAEFLEVNTTEIAKRAKHRRDDFEIPEGIKITRKVKVSIR